MTAWHGGAWHLGAMTIALGIVLAWIALFAMGADVEPGELLQTLRALALISLIPLTFFDLCYLCQGRENNT